MKATHSDYTGRQRAVTVWHPSDKEIEFQVKSLVQTPPNSFETFPSWLEMWQREIGSNDVLHFRFGMKSRNLSIQTQLLVEILCGI